MKRHVFKPSRKVNGKKVVSRCYSGRYRLDGDLTDTQVSLNTTDKQVAEAKLREIVRAVEMERQGLASPRIQIETASLPLQDPLKDWLNDLASKGRKPKYVRIMELTVGVLMRECGWVRVRDIRPESFMAWRDSNQSKAPKTLNEYLGAVSAFLNWLVKNGRCPANPLVSVGKVETRGRERRVRRSLSHEEFLRLIEVADDDRAAVYSVAYYTGLRRDELVKALWADFDLNSETATVTVFASDTKNKGGTKLPLHSDLKALLLRYRASSTSGVASGAALVVPERLTAFNKDLKAAGIPRLDERGRRIDLHALRHSCCTRLATSGAPLAVAMKMMRHSDPRLTAKTYVDEAVLPLAETIEKLPGMNPLGHSLIDSPESVVSGQNVSRDVAIKSPVGDSQSTLAELLSRALSLLDANCQMAPAVGIEPTT